jgi:hypothetical protein
MCLFEFQALAPAWSVNEEQPCRLRFFSIPWHGSAMREYIGNSSIQQNPKPNGKPWNFWFRFFVIKQYGPTGIFQGVMPVDRIVRS